jgi:spore germination protein GerM
MRGRNALIAIGLLLVAAAVVWWLRPVRATVSVYFVRAEASSSTLQDVPRAARGRGLAALLTVAVRELLAGPSSAEQAAGLVTAIPLGTRLRDLRIEDGVVIIDLSAEIASGGGSSSMLGRLWQIVYTATQFTQAPRVRILIDGQARQSMGGEGVLIDHPLARPASLPIF